MKNTDIQMVKKNFKSEGRVFVLTTMFLKIFIYPEKLLGDTVC